MLSVCINHYKSPVALKICINSIKEHLGHIRHEIIVADSAATAESKDLIRHDFPTVTHVAFNDNVGFARLVNAGIGAATGEFLLFLNADTVLTKGAVETMLAYLKKHDDVAMVGPRLEYMNGKHQPSAFRYYAPLTILARRTPYGKTASGKKELDRFMLHDVIKEPIAQMQPTPVDWLMGSVMLVRRSAIDAVGILDTRYFLYMEDVDWCRRFWEKKWKVVWLPAARVVHVHGKGSRKKNAFIDLFTNKLARIHFKSAIKYFKKFGADVPRYGA